MTNRVLYIALSILFLPLAPFLLIAYLCHSMRVKSQKKLMQKQLLIYKQRGHTVLPGIIWNIRNKQNDYSLMFKEL